MTNKKFKNVDFTKTRYADYCELYGEETVSAFADEYGVEKVVDMISSFEDAMMKQEGLISLFYHADELRVAIFHDENSFSLGNCCEGNPYIIIPVFDCSEFDKHAMCLEDTIHAVINTLLTKEHVFEFLQNDCLVYDKCC